MSHLCIWKIEKPEPKCLMRRHLMPFAFPNVCIYIHIYVSRRRENWEKSLYPQHGGQKKSRKYKYIVEWDVYTVERVVSRSSVNFFFSLFFLLIFLGRSSGRKKKKKKSRSRRAVLAAMTTAAGNLTISRRPLCAQWVERETRERLAWVKLVSLQSQTITVTLAASSVQRTHVPGAKKKKVKVVRDFFVFFFLSSDV